MERIPAQKLVVGDPGQEYLVQIGQYLERYRDVWAGWEPCPGICRVVVLVRDTWGDGEWLLFDGKLFP